MSSSLGLLESSRFSDSLILSSLKSLIEKGQRLSKIQKRIFIGTAIFATLSYFLFKRISTPPKRLRHIPSVNYVQMMKAYLAGESLNSIVKRIVNPVLNPKGLYLRPSRGLWNIYVTDPQLAKIVYNKTDLFPKVDLTETNKGTYNGKFSVRSNNIFFAVGDEWKRQRRIANPAFHRAMPIQLFGNYTERLFDSVTNHTAVNTGEAHDIDIGDFIKRYALDVIGSAGFDFEFNSLHDPKSEYAERYEKVMNAVIDPLFYFFPAFDQQFLWMFPKRIEVHKELDIFLSMVREIIKKKRETLAKQKILSNLNVSGGDGSTSSGSTEKDILTLLMESADTEENSDLTITDDDMLMSNLCILFTAGHETTTAAIVFLMYELALHQDMQQKARDEVIKVFGNDNITILPTAEQLSKLDYLNILIKETLRLHTPVPVSGPRLATEDTYLGETFVPKGSTVVVDVISLHRNPKDWSNPDEFNPDRFLPEGEVEKQAGSGLTYGPFGAGSRHCIGRNFALNEQKVLLSMFLKKYIWELPEDSIHKNGLQTKGIFLLSPVDMRLIIKSRY